MATTITGNYEIGDGDIEVEVCEPSATVAIEEFKKVVKELVLKEEKED